MWQTQMELPAAPTSAMEGVWGEPTCSLPFSLSLPLWSSPALFALQINEYHFNQVFILGLKTFEIHAYFFPNVRFQSFEGALIPLMRWINYFVFLISSYISRHGVVARM